MIATRDPAGWLRVHEDRVRGIATRHKADLIAIRAEASKPGYTTFVLTLEGQGGTVGNTVHELLARAVTQELGLVQLNL